MVACNPSKVVVSVQIRVPAPIEGHLSDEEIELIRLGQ